MSTITVGSAIAMVRTADRSRRCPFPNVRSRGGIGADQRRERLIEQAADEPRGSVGKALQVLDCLGRAWTPLGLSELARRCELAKTTCLRLLRELVDQGYVVKVGSRYRLSWRIVELNRGVSYCEPGGLRELAQPHLSDLHQASGWSVNLAVLDRAEVLYLTRIRRATSPALPGGTGARLPATCTAIGKALLAFQPAEQIRAVLLAGLPALTPYSVTSPRVLEAQLSQVRSIGLAREQEEASVGVMCLAAPILHQRRAVAAISISGPAGRKLDRPLDGVLRRAAASTASDYASALRQAVAR